MSLKDVALKALHFKSFGSSAQGFDEIRPINVIIGRNNTGKSALVDLVDFACKPRDIPDIGHRGKSPSALLTRVVPQSVTSQFATVRLNVDGANHTVDHDYFSRNFENKSFVVEIDTKGSQCVVDCPSVQYRKDIAMEAARLIVGKMPNPFQQYQFRRIASERDIQPEAQGSVNGIGAGGRGLTAMFDELLNAAGRKRSLIVNEVRSGLNFVLSPDVQFSQILVQRHDNGTSELFFVEEGHEDTYIPLSRLGSGVKTILMVLANLLVLPRLENPSGRPLAEYLFAFEELENCLHPATQRRLFKYIRDTIVDAESHLFITTHSNIVVDLFSNDEAAQILHVTHDRITASVKRVESYLHGRGVLEDLGIRASDLLQINAVVWVEGPSDAIYFNKWVEIWSDGSLAAGIHFQCVPFGGSVGADFSFSMTPADEEQQKIIEALKVNPNIVFIADRDRGTSDGKWKAFVERLSTEVAKCNGYPWVTAGREIENYIPGEILNELAGTPVGQFDDAVQAIADKRGIAKKSVNKPDLARDIADLLTRANMTSTLDLSWRLDAVCAFIRKWNGMS